MEWYDNTMFVITADHSSGHYAPPFKTTVGLFAVPIIFYKSDGSLKGRSDVVAQQIDIMPSILSYLNYDQPYVAFGNDLFNDSTVSYAINYVSGSYQIISSEFALQFDGNRTFGLYEYRNDPLMKRNLMDELTQVRASLELNLKARIQQYNNRLAENRMTVD
jgi:phosphoglycerol transferase MdoB-like AlkP superfamily enzyme